MPDTAVITIGNSDDKLSQKEWSLFVSEVYELIMQWGYPIHFHGFSPGYVPWQNCCWVVEITAIENKVVEIEYFRDELGRLARRHKQDSIALTLGDTEFVKGE